jgi:hypothetical protein
VLKLARVIDWSWWWLLLAPAVGAVAALVLAAIVALILYLRHQWFMRLVRRNRRSMLDLQPPFRAFGYRYGYSGLRPGYHACWKPSATKSASSGAGDDAQDEAGAS